MTSSQDGALHLSETDALVSFTATSSTNGQQCQLPQAAAGASHQMCLWRGPTSRRAHSFQHLQPGAGVPAIGTADLRGPSWITQKLEMLSVALCRLHSLVFVD